MVNYSLYLLPKISVKLKLVGPGTHISAIVPTQFLSHHIHTLFSFSISAFQISYCHSFPKSFTFLNNPSNTDHLSTTDLLGHIIP